jgi:hypothetical protein
MTTSTSLSSRRGLGGFAALAGGALMVVSVFLPWLSSPMGGDAVTGWDTYDLSSGAEKFFVQEAFDTGFSPMFTGMSVIIAGGLLALIGLAMLASLRGGAFALASMGKTIVVIITLLVFIVGVTNLISLYATGNTDVVTPGFGLYLLTGGAIIGLIGAIAASGKGSS